MRQSTMVNKLYVISCMQTSWPRTSLTAGNFAVDIARRGKLFNPPALHQHRSRDSQGTPVGVHIVRVNQTAAIV